jgi:NAD(P)-dependent dehydrogenase (short-subunit alcohol dehydrogenase family)
MDLTGRSIVITGAGAGLGREYALQLAAAGARVMVNDLGGATDGTGASSTVADDVVAEIRTAGGEAVANADSVADRDGASRIVQAAVDAFGRLHGVICNAGILRDRSFHKMSDEDWATVLDVHLNGTYNVIRAAWPYLREQGHGRVMATSSNAGLFGNFGQANYGAAKLGIVGLVKTLAIEGERFDIRVNAVSPTGATRLTRTAFSGEQLERFDPKYVAPLACVLMSAECPASGWIIRAGGGQYARVELMQAEGWQSYPEAATPAELFEHWEQITDMSGCVPGGLAIQTGGADG